VGLFKSNDGAHSFQGPTEILPNNFNNQNGSIAVLPNGNIVLPFFELGIIDEVGRELPLAHPRLWVSRSEDGGQTLSRPFFVGEARLPGPPPVAQATINSEDVLLTWVTDHRVRLWYSKNGGETWVESVWTASNDIRTSSELSTVSVSRIGTIGLAWIKRATVSKAARCWQLMFTASLDGGKTLLPSTPVPDALWCANGRWSTGGDYFGLSPGDDGSFKLLWADNREGYFRLRLTSIFVTKERP
jgi:hypothetical protein